MTKRFWKPPLGVGNYAETIVKSVPERDRAHYHHRSVERIIEALEGRPPVELVSVLASIITPPHLKADIHKRTILICMLKDHMLCADCLPSTRYLGESYLLDHSRMVIYDEIK